MIYNNELIVGLILILIAICYFIFTKKKVKYLENIPGPPSSIFFGNGLQFVFASIDEFLQMIVDITKTYGGIVQLKSGPLKQHILITDQKFTEFILTSTKLLDKGENYKYLYNWLGSGLLTSTGAKWKQRRRIITPAFHFSILEQFTEIFEKMEDVLVEKLNHEVGKESVDIYPFVTLCTLDIICEAAMGTSVNAQQNKNSLYVEMVKFMCNLLVLRTFWPLNDALYFLRPLCYQEKRALKVLHSYTNSVIDRKIKELENNNTKLENDGLSEFGIRKKLAFLDLLLQSNIDGEPLSREELREEVDTFMFEGHDTTASAITFALYELANNPNIQQKVLEEQNQIFDDFKMAKVTNKELNEMKYLDLVIKETLRMYPPVPMIARETTEDFEYEGSIFPKNASLVIFTFGMHRNPKFFPEPEKFIPERFEEITGKDPFSYIPFSAGSRNCIGQKFAIFEMKSAISKVIRNFKVFPAKPKHVLKLAPETVLLSKNGVCISLKKR